MIELQLRTKLQHSWATAVETAGTFLQYSLKSSQGPDEWLQFFSLVSAACSYREDTPRVSQFSSLTKSETNEFVTNEAERLAIKHTLRTFSVAADHISRDKKAGSYYLLVLDPVRMSVSIQAFARSRLQEANDRYSEIEKQIREGSKQESVLVSAGSIEQLKRAYPNYFLDTSTFIDFLDSLNGK